MTKRKAVASILVPLVLSGCASSTAVLGRAVEVRQTSGSSKDPVRGELIAVGPDTMWVAGPENVRAIPRGAVQDVQVKRHGLTKSKALRWVIIGALVSGIALSLACSSVEDAGGCGSIFIPVGLTWGAIGVPSAMSLGESSRLRVTPAKWDSLSAYARFPQGLPEGVDPDSLVPGQTPPTKSQVPAKY